VDIYTQDIVHFLIVSKESLRNFRLFICQIKEEINYPLQGAVIDLRSGLSTAIREFYPGIPIQACVIHLSRQIDYRLPKSRKSPFYEENKTLRKILHSILFAEDIKKAYRSLKCLEKVEKDYQTRSQRSVIKMVKWNLPLILAHHFHKALPRDNNIIENVIKQLNRKIKLVEGFKSEESAKNYLKLLIMHYRFKEFNNSSDKSKNGKSPLQLAGVNTKGLDWLLYEIDFQRS